MMIVMIEPFRKKTCFCYLQTGLYSLISTLVIHSGKNIGKVVGVRSSQTVKLTVICMLFVQLIYVLHDGDKSRNLPGLAQA